jgi:hypothetical protein
MITAAGIILGYGFSKIYKQHKEVVYKNFQIYSEKIARNLFVREDHINICTKHVNKWLTCSFELLFFSGAVYAGAIISGAVLCELLFFAGVGIPGAMIGGVVAGATYLINK